MIKILFFASLKDVTGCSEQQLELAEGVETIADLIVRLGELLGERWVTSVANSTVLCALNQEICSIDTKISDGDEIAFFPPVTGG